MEETKKWYQSRTVIAGILGVVYALLAMFGIVPDPMTQEFVLEAVMGVLGLLTIYFRFKSTKEIQ